MVDKTLLEIKKNDIPNANMLLMDNESLEFEDNSFDCVLCAFGLFFFTN